VTPQNGTGDNFPKGECTDWASFRYHQLTGYYVPWSGNAFEWSGNAIGYGWTVSALPSVPSIACFQPGVQGADSTFGHVSVVESVDKDGTITTSNYNVYPHHDDSVVVNLTPKAGGGVSFITAGAGATGDTPTGSSQVTLKDFCTAVANRLRNDKGVTNVLGAGPSQSIINFLIAWAMQESGANIKSHSIAAWNVFNTTQQEDGSTNFNALGVQNYPTQGDGENATAHTLENGLYPNLWNALATNDENSLGFHGYSMHANVARNLYTWVSGSTNSTSSNTHYVLSIMANAGIAAAKIEGLGFESNLPAATQNQIDGWGSQVIGAYTPSNPVSDTITGITNAFSNFNTFFGNLNSFLANPIRLVEIASGSVLVIIGLALLAYAFRQSSTGKTVAGVTKMIKKG
jgi:surface antigen